MLSIIICHRNIALLNQIKKNIDATVGVTYELIIIDNTQNNYSIFAAYNEGVKRSKYPILCFTHEDIYYHSNNWGEKVLEHFNDQNTGLIGVSGGTIQSHVPSSWWYNHHIGAAAVNLIMADKKQNGKLVLHYNNPGTNKLKCHVVVVDGLWFCIRKSLFNKIKFDENTFTGFHAYDIDISLQINNIAKNYVVFDILIEHIWEGTIDKKYYYELIKLAGKWRNYLPINTGNFKKFILEFYYWHTLRNFILNIIQIGFSKHEVQNILRQYLPGLKVKYPSPWFQLYFNLSKIFGFKKVNSLFFRIEKLAGYSKLPGYIKKPIDKIRLQTH